MSDPLVVVGIDLGTHATGFGWAVIDEQNEQAEERRIHFFTQWPGQPVPSVKNLSALQLGEGGEVLAWGYEARRRALNRIGGPGTRYRAAFKMELMGPASRKREQTHLGREDEPPQSAVVSEREESQLPDGASAPHDDLDAEEDAAQDEDQGSAEPGLTTGEPVSEAELLTTELLARVRAAAMEQITASGYLEDDVRYCVTVPAMFTDMPKQKVRRCAAAAGFSTEDGRLILAFEPEAAAHYARVSGARPPGEEDQPPTDLLAPGRLILVVDSGGGTVDLAAYKNDADGRMAEIGLVNGGRHGSNELNRRFEDRLLADRFGKPELVEQLWEEVPEAMLELSGAWERGKLGFGPDTEDPLPLTIPTAIDRKLGAAVRKRLARKQRGVTDSVIISPQEMRDLFDTVVPDVLELVDEQLAEIASQSSPGSPRPVVLMVGGFSNSAYLQHALKQHLNGRAHVLIPPDPGAAVLHGAVHFAYKPQTRARRARFTYGVLNCQRFEPGTDPEKSRWVASDGTAYCATRFSKLVAIGDLVDTAEEVTGWFVPIEGTSRQLKFDLYTSTQKDPRYVTDPGCERIGTIKVDLTTVMKYALDDRRADLYLRFGETEIKVRAVVRKSGEEAATTVHFASDY